MTLLNIGKIVTAVDHHAAYERDDADEILAVAVTEVYRKTEDLPSYKQPLHIAINNLASIVVLRYVSDRDGIPLDSLRRGEVVPNIDIIAPSEVPSSGRTIAFPQPSVLDLDDVDTLASLESTIGRTFRPYGHEPILEHMREGLYKQERVLMLATGMEDGEPKTYDEIKEREGISISKARVGQIFHAAKARLVDALKKDGDADEITKKHARPVATWQKVVALIRAGYRNGEITRELKIDNNVSAFRTIQPSRERKVYRPIRWGTAVTMDEANRQRNLMQFVESRRQKSLSEGINLNGADELRYEDREQPGGGAETLQSGMYFRNPTELAREWHEYDGR